MDHLREVIAALRDWDQPVSIDELRDLWFEVRQRMLIEQERHMDAPYRHKGEG